MKKALSLFISASLFLALTVELRSQNSDRVYQFETFQLSNPELIDVRTSGGSIQIEGSELDEVRVEMYVRYRGRYLAPSDTDLNDFDIRIEQVGNRVIAHAERTTERGWRFWRDFESISFVVYTPSNTNVKARTSGGSVSAASLNGTIELRTSGGSISLENLAGVIEARTSGGSLSMTEIDGSLSARTSGGSIRLEQAVGEFDLRTSGGGMRFEEVSGKLAARTSGGSIRAKMGSVEDLLDLRTSGGSITIEVPRGGYDLNLRGNRVRTELINFSGNSERSRIEGSMDGGGPLIRARTSGGSVTLNYF